MITLPLSGCSKTSLTCIFYFPGGSDSKASAYNVGDLGWEDLLEKGNGNALQYSCLENPMDGEAW